MGEKGKRFFFSVEVDGEMERAYYIEMKITAG